MRWTPGGRSSNIEDERDSTGGGGGGFSIGGGTGLGLGGTVLLLILSFVFKQNFFALLGGSHSSAPSAPVTQAEKAQDAREEPTVQFISFALDDIQKNWSQILSTRGTQYRDAKLVLFRDSINSACGFAQAATGPFYCPPDQRVYIDLGFFNELKNRFGASGGEFAEAYVLAHEVGHHVQNLLGIERKVRQLRQSNPGSNNALSVRVELQADCLAGVWGHTTQRRNLLEPGEEEEALNAAAAIGDDRLQRMSTGHVSPESFTHGSSAQRVHWFKAGFDSGDISSCNTFAQ